MIAGKSFFVVAAGLLMAGSIMAPVAVAAGSSCEHPHDTEPTRTFDVRIKVVEDVYRLGETAQFRVKVTRALHGQRVAPAEGAEVSVTIDLGDVTLAGGAVTNDEGRALVKVLLRDHASTGWADVAAHAHKHTVDVPCHSELEQEFGSVEKGDLFKVVR